MRFDTPIHFKSIKQGDYDEHTGNNGNDNITEVKKYASVTDCGVDTIKLIYGTIKQGSLIVKIQDSYKEPFDFIRIGDKDYKVDMSRKLRTKQVFIVSEKQ